MTPREYIDSGILETYVLGAATPAERQEVEMMCSRHPEVKQALDQVAADLEEYATLHAVQPDEALREKILASALGNVNTGNGVAGNGKIVALPVAATSARWKTMAYAASVVVLLSVGANIFLWLRLNSTNEKAESLAQTNSTLKRFNDSLESDMIASSIRLSDQRDSMAYVLAFLRSPMTKSIALNSMIKDHPMRAMVHWDMKTMKIAVDPMTLPETAPDQKYVLWAIVDGKPVNEGGFSVAPTSGILMMDTVPTAQAFAISLEKDPGVNAPQGQIYVMGQSAP